MFTAVPAVITTRSPSVTSPLSRDGVERHLPQVLDVLRLLDPPRRHPPLERHVLERVLVVAEPEDRAARAQPRDDRGRSAGERRHDDRPRAERLGEVARCVRHRLADRRLLLGLGELMPVAEARLDGARDPVHVRDRLDRVLAHRRLGREHQRRRAVEHGVRDVARLGARRLRLVDHRLEHLRRRDHRLPSVERALDDPLLEERHRRRPDLHAEVAARDHHRIRLLEDLVERVDRLRLLDLRDHVRVRVRLRDQRAQVADVGRRSHERQRDEVDAELERELEVFGVLPRERGIGIGTPGRFTPLWELTGPPTITVQLARPFSTSRTSRRTWPSSISTSWPGRSTSLITAGLTGRSPSLASWAPTITISWPRTSDERLEEIADPELRALEVGDQRERAANLLLRVAQEPNGLRVLLVRAVGEVEAGAVHARVDQRLDRLLVRRRRPDRRDDLRAARFDRGHAS